RTPRPDSTYRIVHEKDCYRPQRRPAISRRFFIFTGNTSPPHSIIAIDFKIPLLYAKRFRSVLIKPRICPVRPQTALNLVAGLIGEFTRSIPQSRGPPTPGQIPWPGLRPAPWPCAEFSARGCIRRPPS